MKNAKNGDEIQWMQRLKEMKFNSVKTENVSDYSILTFKNWWSVQFYSW